MPDGKPVFLISYGGSSPEFHNFPTISAIVGSTNYSLYFIRFVLRQEPAKIYPRGRVSFSPRTCDHDNSRMAGAPLALPPTTPYVR